MILWRLLLVRTLEEITDFIKKRESIRDLTRKHILDIYQVLAD